jgi:hypothetical protein
MDNQTDQPQVHGFCCELTFVHVFDLFGEDGHRVLTDIEAWNEKHGSSGNRMIEECTCSGFAAVPAHTMKIVD